MTHFTKSHGLGNDYLVLEPAALPFTLTHEAIKLICHRNLGVGADGILALRPPMDAGNFAMTIHNPDGSEAEKSGNGIRIFAHYLYAHGKTERTSFTIETPGGAVATTLGLRAGEVVSVLAEMGVAEFLGPNTVEVDGEILSVTCLSVGNPHCVLVVDDLADVDFYRLGPAIENHPAFPQRTNVQFAQVLARDLVRARIWERGAGETLASGSSSCAVAAACRRLGLVTSKLTVRMDGGDLQITIGDDAQIVMDGPVEETFSGDFSPRLLNRLQSLS